MADLKKIFDEEKEKIRQNYNSPIAETFKSSFGVQENQSFEDPNRLNQSIGSPATPEAPVAPTQTAPVAPVEPAVPENTFTPEGRQIDPETGLAVKSAPPVVSEEPTLPPESPAPAPTEREEGTVTLTKDGNTVKVTSDQETTFLAQGYVRSGTEPPAPTSAGGTDTDFGVGVDDIQANLESKKNAIRAKYNVERDLARERTENERKSELSNLYSVGEVNPLSSGSGSIKSASNRDLDRRMDAINAIEQAEIADAEDTAFDRRESGADRERQAVLDEEARIQTSWENSRKALSDSLELAKTGRAFSQQDKENAYNDFSNMVTLGGSLAFEDFEQEDYDAIDKSLGLTSGVTKNMVRKVKELELKGESTLEVLPDKSVVSWKQDKKGEWSYTTLIKAPPTAPKAKKAGVFFKAPDPISGEISSFFGQKNDVENARKISEADFLRGTGEEIKEELDQDTVSIILSSAVDDDGNLDVSKIPSAERTEVLKKAGEFGLFDEMDEENRNILGNIISGKGTFFGQQKGKG